ncbi:Outer membrane receptor for ferrienterochelin and colicins [Pedobacter caeni]|uniref:Outer membrane receptor for ferrienterochelin and colicins n=2 Tax=Pedobacter caeni TaxID=288992 RepID=A0A1M5NCP2_9SPHI|nr:Outer membrane receptor for ferrienterochelin and colicins [Pedobacter caeni]
MWFGLHLQAPAQEPHQKQSPLRSIAFSSIKRIDQEDIRQMAANNLADVFRYQLNIEVENSPELGGARSRTADLNSRHFKILVDGIPLASADMFGSHIDLSSIPMSDVDYIEISEGGMGPEYGSGSLMGVVNVVKHKVAIKNILSFSSQEGSAGNEYNLKSGNEAKGRHIQNLGLNYLLSKNLSVGFNLNRDQFNGHRGRYLGKNYLSENSYQRGYAWSPRTSWDINGHLAYKGKDLSAFYQFNRFNADLTFYGHNVEQEYLDNIPLPVYSTDDFRYVNNRWKHHLNLKGAFWKDADYTLDLSLQAASNKRNIKKVNAANHDPLEDMGLKKLYAINTFYSRFKLSKPLVKDQLIWDIGYELDHTNGYVAVEPGTYISKPVDENVFSISVFTQVQWQISEKFAIQHGLRLSRYHQTMLFVSPALSLNYHLNGHNDFKLILEKTDRAPNHRELFTYLENEFNLLEGEPCLKPETGKSVLLSWQNSLKTRGGIVLQTKLSSGFRQLKNRIVIATAANKIPTQDAYRYTNLNEYYGWLNKIEMNASSHQLKVNLGISVLGTKGNDFGTASEYDRYLFHLEGISGIAWHFKNYYWLNVNYRFVGNQFIYSFEREAYSQTKNRVLNRTPMYHLLDLNTGSSFFSKRLETGIGVKNLFNTRELNYSATDGQEHYRGDLRTQYIGYGRNFYLSLKYNF